MPASLQKEAAIERALDSGSNITTDQNLSKQPQSKDGRSSALDEGYGSMPQVEQDGIMPSSSPLSTSFRLSTSSASSDFYGPRQLGRQMGPLRQPLRNLKSMESFERLSAAADRSSVSTELLESPSTEYSIKDSRYSFMNFQSQDLVDLERMTLDEQNQYSDESRMVDIDKISSRDSYTRASDEDASPEVVKDGNDDFDFAVRGDPEAGNLKRWKPIPLYEKEPLVMSESRSASDVSNSSSNQSIRASDDVSETQYQRRPARSGDSDASSERQLSAESPSYAKEESPASSSSSFTASFSTSSSRNESQSKLQLNRRNAEKMPSSSSSSNGLPTYSEDVRRSVYHQPESPRPSRALRPNTAPGANLSSFSSRAPAIGSSSLARQSRTPQYASSLHPLREDIELPIAVSAPHLPSTKSQTLHEQQHEEEFSPARASFAVPVTMTPTPAASKPSGMSKWISRLPLPRWISGRRADDESKGSKLHDSTPGASTASATTPPSNLKLSRLPNTPILPSSTTSNSSSLVKRSFSAGVSKAKLSQPRLLSPKDGMLRQQQLAPTSVPSKSAKGNQVANSSTKQRGQAAKEDDQSAGRPEGTSSKTLKESFSGTIWDDEEAARTASVNAKDSESEATLAAKMRLDGRYKVQKQLGSGGHSTVRLANRISDDLPVVLKYIKNCSVWHWAINPSTKKRYPLEIHLMRKFSKEGNHPNIIKYIEHFELNNRYIIVMEYLGEDWIDLYDFIEFYGPVKERVSVEIFHQVVDTILFLYKKGYHHNDIKDENILINVKTRNIKLIDFGSATAVEPGKTCELFYGTKKFSAPEAVRGEPYHPEAQEVWALGTLLFVLLFKLDPFTNDEEILGTDIGRRIAKYRAIGVGGNGKGPEISDEAAISLRMMMEKDWARRAPLDKIIKLPIFQKWC